MSSAPNASHVSSTEVKSSPSDVSKRSEMETQLEACLDSILYDGCLFFRPVTHSLLKRVEEAKATIDEANTLFIEGIRRFGRVDSPFEYLSRAEEKGCNHPFLPYFLAECHRASHLGCPKDEAKALEYYDLAIKGGCIWVYQDPSIQCRSQGKKDLHYFLDLEREGIVCDDVFINIGSYKELGIGCRKDRSMAAEYYRRAADCGFVSGYQNLSLMWRDYNYDDDDDDDKHAERILSPVLEAEEKGLAIKYDFMLRYIIDALGGRRFDKYNTNPIGKYQTRGEMALHYCDVLIQRASPLGYSLKGDLYMKGSTGVPKDEAKAVSIWEEADRLGLATFHVYSRLQLAYKEGKGAPVDGMKVLAYAEKALQVVSKSAQVIHVFEWMVDVYRKGITPVSQDGNKVMECCHRALQTVVMETYIAKIYSWMGNVYKEGIQPVVQDGTKALELYDMAIQLDNRFDIFYISKAEVYLKGIHPIPQDGARALKCYEAALPHIGNYSNIQGCIAQLYEIGVAPIAQDLRKAQEHRDKEFRNSR